MKKSEFAVGEEFQFGRLRLRCVREQEEPCYGCYFADIDKNCLDFSDLLGYCSVLNRTDKTDVIFVEVK